MRQVLRERVECALEVDIILPERVIRVEDQKLPVHYKPAGLPPKPFVGARPRMRWMARCFGTYSARNAVRALRRVISERCRRSEERRVGKESMSGCGSGV